MGGAITEERAINHAQYLYLVYSQSGTLYHLIPQAPHPITDPTKPPAETPVDGIVGSIQPSLVTKTTNKPNVCANTPSNPMISTEVNVIQITQTPDNKKKCKDKNKKNLVTNKRILRLQPQRMIIKGRERPSTLACYVVVITS